MQVPDVPQAVVWAATVISVGPVNVEFAGVVQSAWKCQVASVVLVEPRPTTVLSSPDGGSVEPSRSAARIPP